MPSAYPAANLIDVLSSQMATAQAMNQAKYFVGERIAPLATVPGYTKVKYYSAPVDIMMGSAGLDLRVAKRMRPRVMGAELDLIEIFFQPLGLSAERDIAMEINEALAHGAPNPIDIDQRKIVKNLLNKKESEILGMFSDPVITNVHTIAPGDEWNVYSSATSDPFGDVQAAADLITGDGSATGTGISKSSLTLTINQRTFDFLAQHPQVTSRVKFNGAVADAYSITTSALAAFFGVKEVVVAGAYQLGTTDLVGAIMNDFAGLSYIDPTMAGANLEEATPNAMRWIQVDGGSIIVTARVDTQRGQQGTLERNIWLPGAAIIQNATAMARIQNVLS